jgi:hypothetical protein
MDSSLSKIKGIFRINIQSLIYNIVFILLNYNLQIFRIETIF